MIPRTPTLLKTLLVLATIGSLLAMPLQAAAAPRGKQATFNVTPLIATVSTGQPGAFQVFVRNDGPGTFTHARLEGTAPGGTFVSAPDGCTGSGATVTCELGKLKDGDSATLVIVFDAPGDAGTITFDATLRIDAGGNNQNAASQDTFTGQADIAVSDDPGFFGRWQAAHAGTQHFQTASTNVKVDVPPVDTAYAAVLDESIGDFTCTNEVPGGSPIGDVIGLSIADGASFSPNDPLEVTVTYDVDPYFDVDELVLIHLLGDIDAANGECEVIEACDECYDPVLPCFEAELDDGILTVTVYLLSNGRMKGV
ncbi:MAG: hypothetical protein ACRDGD_11300 [Candidatus Limnocylindria bacterium]